MRIITALRQGLYALFVARKQLIDVGLASRLVVAVIQARPESMFTRAKF